MGNLELTVYNNSKKPIDTFMQPSIEAPEAGFSVYGIANKF